MPLSLTSSSAPPGDGRNPALFLERTYSRFHKPRWIGADPLAWPRAYDDPADREVAAWLAGALAYGNVRQIERSLAGLFRRLGRSPARFVRNFTPGQSDRALAGFYHRFNDARDIAALLHLTGQMLRRSGSIEAFWHEAQPANSRDEPIELKAGRFMDAILALEAGPYYPQLRRGSRDSVLYLLPDVAGPSACKRFFLFLRWVVRPDDGIDLGLWNEVSRAELEFPVDTHVLRLARYLGATSRNDAGARTRREITAYFREFDPTDPVRFDFSLCRLGIERFCPTRSDLARCDTCDLRSVCLRHEALTCTGRLPKRLARLNLLDKTPRRTGKSRAAAGNAG